MMAVLLAAVLLAALAWGLRLPGRVVAAMAVLLWCGVVLLHLTAPGSAAARAVGGDLRVWLVAGGVAALVLAYRAGLTRLRRAAPAPPDQPERAGLADAELDRYARHLVLREIGGPGQMRLRQARVLIVGGGGLGAPVCLYLAAAGVGRITLADDDVVSLSNLHRQVIFRDADTRRPKAAAAAAAMLALNPHIQVTPLARRISEADQDLIAQHDLVLDGTDSFATRQAVNRACVAAGVPLIAGSIAQWEGQVTLYDPARGGPCLACLFPVAPAPGLAPPCAEAGVVGALPGVIGSMMALEAIKHLTDAGQGLRRRMVLFDGLYGENRTITTEHRADCPVCGHNSNGG
ncbi:MAG: HesA/MoeB/ThiF family protein [Paracoccus sp. (in: a-proteobacteria)]|uniref:HesA/MoeB/ThiF family protein n=1 Tax=Paracoccus sp. TaxID=267 RepID=UPI0026DFFEE2|nr:HesA/MoeB/ThiF family protein [Paracoccus sp. (in: a-proteobacteria)]MDO5631319.1 HesA/MoeB/ThiF family protein [Paracoccus sp. (in: a-proteobacteria)]